MPSRLLAVLTLFGCVPLTLAADTPARGRLPAPAARKVDFTADIQPIFTRACLSCHGAEKQRGGLRLDDGELARKGGNSGALYQPGRSGESRLIQVVAGLDPEMRMPPGKGKELSALEIGLLRAWIDQGAVWPRGSGGGSARPRSNHWAFQPIRCPPVPQVKETAWLRTPVDAFVLARLEREGIRPSPEADRITLLRRLHFDLIGLPPSPGEVDAFIHDRRPGAYERLVDRLLASPHYGERWGRHWLDLARYADSDGYEKDSARPHAWRYRHWVIEALNADMPFDRFTTLQLAGDLLPGASVEQKVATGFHRNTLTNREGGVDREQFRVEAVVDRVNTTAKVWLGLTMGCAQCHDHKYDPLSMRDYYGLFAFFNSDVEVDIPAPVPAFPPAALPPPKGKKAQPVPGKSLAQTLALGAPRKTHVLIRGDFLRPGAEVTPATPSVLPPLRAKANPTRLDLARWLVDPANPLTPRVTANALWQRFFGRGLVATPDDFGTQGEKPSHPQLLDWLASELVRRGWGMKEMHRLIVTSAVYRQSSHVRDDLLSRDPGNFLLARQMRQRLEAETVRDALLTSSGLLVRTIGGPSVRPPQPAGISELTYAGSARWVESTGADRYRRGLYTWFQRTSPYPMLLTFDAPDANLSCVRREKSNTPLQALTLLNDTPFVECARALAQRVLRECAGDTTARLAYCFRLCTARTPTPREKARLRMLHDDLVELCAADIKGSAQLLAGPPAAGTSLAESAAWIAIARALLNLDEVVTRE